MKLEDVERADGLRAYRDRLIAMKLEIKEWHDGGHKDLFMFGPESLDPMDNKALPIDVRSDKPFRAIIQFLHTLTKLAEEDLRNLGVDIPAQEEEDDGDDEDLLREELANLEAEFDRAGGRGVELANRIDELREELEGEEES